MVPVSNHSSYLFPPDAGGCKSRVTDFVILLKLLCDICSSYFVILDIRQFKAVFFPQNV